MAVVVGGLVEVEPPPPLPTAAQNLSIPVCTLPFHLSVVMFLRLGIGVHTIVSLAARVAQADLAVSPNCVDQRADAAVVIGGTSRVLGDGIGDARGSASWDKVVDAEGSSHGGESREREDSKRCHFDEDRCSS